MKAKKFFGFDESVARYAVMTIMAIFGLIICGEYFGWFGNDRYEELKKSHREKVNLLTLQNQIQSREISELKDQLRLLESSAKKPEVEQSQVEEVQVEEETQAHNPPQKNELVGKLESMSDPDWQAWLLKNADAKDRKILEGRFKQENEFKASLNPAQKQEFEAEVEKAYAHMLANSGVEGELSDLQKQVTRRSAETVAMTMVKTKWQSREFLDRWDAKMAALEEEAEERNRLYYEELEEEFLLIHEEFGLTPFDWESLEEVELSQAQKEEMEEEFEAIVEEAERMVEELKEVEGE